MNPYPVLAEAAKQHPSRSFLEVWNDFSCWERARGYADDPNAASKEDIDWIQQLYDLAARLKDKPGDTQDCHNALEAAAAAFAGLAHEKQLYSAIVAWRREKLEEKQTSKNASSA